MNAPARRWSISLRRLALAALSGAAFPVAAQAFTLEMPVDCDMRTVCSIHKFMDHDPSPARMDYACGRLSKDGDNGADFRVPNLAIMEQGVAVTAAADGVVRATREGMADVSVRKIGQDAIRGRFAGNAVVLTHPGGWETQYSHLKLGSVRVRKGERVRAGDVIGEIGLSGNTEFPHVEFSLRRNGKPVDPFVGELAPDAPFTCGAPRAPLWSAAAQAQLAYRPSGVRNSDCPQQPRARLLDRCLWSRARRCSDYPPHWPKWAEHCEQPLCAQKEQYRVVRLLRQKAPEWRLAKGPIPRAILP